MGSVARTFMAAVALSVKLWRPVSDMVMIGCVKREKRTVYEVMVVVTGESLISTPLCSPFIYASVGPSTALSVRARHHDGPPR